MAYAALVLAPAAAQVAASLPDEGGKAGSDAAEPTRAIRAPESITGSVQMPAVRAHAPSLERKPTAHEPGLSLSIGLGTSYGNMGIQAAYQLPIPDAQFSVFGSVGFAPGREQAPGEVLGVAGVRLSFGASHRLLCDVGIAPAAFRSWNLHGTVVAIQPIYGPYLQLTYEYLWEMGLFVGIGGGVHVAVDYAVATFPALSTGIGWRFR